MSPTELSGPTLERLRDEFVAEHSLDFADESNLCPRLPPALPFYALPEQQLLAYDRHREISELGHVFRIANGLHDFVDAVVVTGSGSAWRGAQALAQACCDPFHNELSRAARGSKPRIYFQSADFDNDRLQSLLARLAAGGYSDSAAESLWALIAIDQPAPCDAQRWLIDHLMRPLTTASVTSKTESGDPVRQQLATAIAYPDSPLVQRFEQLGFNPPLRIPMTTPGAYSLLTPAGLLPAAFLGFDCIQLLVGAAAMNEHFKSTPAEKNMVLRYVAANRQGQPIGTGRLLAVWSRSLLAMGHWVSELHRDSFGGAAGRTETVLGIDRLLDADSETLSSLRGRVCNHVLVQSPRTDPIDTADGNLPDRATDAIAATQSRLAAAGIRQTTLTLPLIDPHSLGQLFQLWMLAASIEAAVIEAGLGV
ncbi:hypothetical protein NHH03_26530 [Stieleria sp. TO1_6]|nr:hypothetical protein [Stieleria tagensis]